MIKSKRLNIPIMIIDNIILKNYENYIIFKLIVMINVKKLKN